MTTHADTPTLPPHGEQQPRPADRDDAADVLLEAYALAVLEDRPREEDGEPAA